MKSKSVALVAFAAVVALAAFLFLDREYHFTGGHGKVVDDLIARNAAARGGTVAWRAVDTLRLTGEMDLGQDVHVPYVLEQKRPGKMCLAFEFNNQTATQCVDGNRGWKQLPFMGRDKPEPMTDAELREMVGAVEVEGLLLDSDKRGYDVDFLGHEMVDGKSTSKLQVTLPKGAVRWVYLDDETGLEVKLEAMRTVRGKERLVQTVYSDWTDFNGLKFPRRQETGYVGDAESHFMTIDKVSVNTPIDDERFEVPMSASAGSGTTGHAS